MGGIGKAIGGALKTVGSIAGKVGEIAGKVADIGGKVLNVLQNPMEALTKPLKDLAGKALDKLPFGLGKLAKPLAEKLIDGAASFLSKGPLGSLGILGQAAKTVGDVVKVAETVKGVADKVGAFANNPLGQANFQNIMAFSHAAHIF
jgi:hypothetical protein